jgi:hypothetical protein
MMILSIARLYGAAGIARKRKCAALVIATDAAQSMACAATANRPNHL